MKASTNSNGFKLFGVVDNPVWDVSSWRVFTLESRTKITNDFLIIMVVRIHVPTMYSRGQGKTDCWYLKLFYGCGGGLWSNRSNQLIIDISNSLPFVVLTVISSAQKDTNFGEQNQLQSVNNGRLFQPIFNLFEMLYGLVSILKNCLIFISKKIF